MGAFCPDRRCRRPQCRALRRPFLPCLIRRWAIHRLRPQCQRLRTTKFPLRQGTFVMRVADNGAEAVPASGLKRYFQEARSWDQDRVRSALRSTRIAWTVAAVTSVLAAASIFAVAALAPLKTVVPYVIRVNQTTGAVDVQTALTQRPMRYDEAVTKYFLAQYVRTRESWIPAAAEENFRSEEHTSELQSLMRISYAVFCLKKKNIIESQPKPQHKMNNL